MRLLSFLLTLLFSINTFASGLSAPFSGSRISGLTRSSTIAEYDSTVDHSGNLVDLSGSNLFTYSDSFDLWGTVVRSSLVADQYRSPETGLKTADVLREDGSNATHYIGHNVTTVSGVYYTYSVDVKAVNRNWIRIYSSSDVSQTYFNASTGLIGTTTNATPSVVVRGGGWYSLVMQWKSVTTGSQTLYLYICDADGSPSFQGVLDQQDFILAGAQLAQNDELRKGSGIYHPTTTANKPLLDMTPAASPTESMSYLQGADGRRLKARTFNGTTQYYSKAHDASMNVFDSDFTFTGSITEISSASGSDGVFRHSDGTNGFTLQVNSSGYVTADFLPVTIVTVIGPSISVRDGRYHTVQLVRRSNIATLLVDGTPGAAYSVSGKGTDLSTALYLGTAGGTYFDGSVLYARIDVEALSDDQLAAEREIIQGTLFGSGNLNPGSTFSRTTTATQAFSDGAVGYVAANVPRVSGDGGGVLAEEQRTNSLTYTGAFSTNWTKTNSSIAGTLVSLPDGTTGTTNVLHEDGTAAASHAMSHTFSAVSGTTYCFSIYAKYNSAAGTPRSWLRLYIDDGTSVKTVYIDIKNGTVGTAGGTLSGSYGVPLLGDGWYRPYICAAATHTSGGAAIIFSIAEADGDVTFDGANQDSTFIFGPQVEAGAHVTSYIPSPTTSLTRTADSFTIEPWKITKPSAGNPMLAMYFDNDVYSAGTYTSEVGNYTFTVAGDTKHIESQTLNDYFSFDGTGDYLTLPDGSGGSDFDSPTSYSVIILYTPTSSASSASIIIGKGGIDGAANYGWTIYQDGAGVYQSISSNGTSRTEHGKLSALVSGKTSLITVTYTAGSGAIMIDALAAGTSAVLPATIYNSADALSIGGSATGARPLNGKIHYIAFLNNTVLTQAQHDTMYAALKQANILPVKIGTSYENKKIYVEFEARCAFSSTADVGSGDRRLLEISGNTGTAASTKNRIVVSTYSNAIAYFTFFDSVGGTARQIYSAALSDWNKWKTYKLYINFSDLSLSTFFINNVAATNVSNLTGSYDLDLTNTLLRLGQDYAGTVNGDCAVRNLRIRAIP